MKLFSAAGILLVSSVGLAQSGGKSIKVFILPSQSAEANEKLRQPYIQMITSPKDKSEIELQKSLGKLVGDTYKTGFRKIELPKCTLYLHKDTRNMEELGKLLSVLKNASPKEGSVVPEYEFKNLPDEVKTVLANVLEVSPDAIKGSAKCALEPTANFAYEFKDYKHQMSFPWTSFDKALKMKMRNLRDDAFTKPEFATEAKAPIKTAKGINQAGFELLVEPGIGGLAETEAIEKSVKYVNEKFASIETDYNLTESRLLDRLAESTFGRGLNSDNYRLKDLEDLSKHVRNSGHGLEALFHDPFMSAAESEAMRSAKFQGVSLCLSLWVMRSEHNGSNATVHLTNPFKRP